MSLSQAQPLYKKRRGAAIKALLDINPERAPRQGNTVCPHPSCNVIISGANDVSEHGRAAHGQNRISVTSSAFLSGKLLIYPYECKHCDYACLKSSNLKRHVATLHVEHAGAVRRFVCPFADCDVLMTNKVALMHHAIWKHRRTLDNTAIDFTCPCGFDFSLSLSRYATHTCEQRPSIAALLGRHSLSMIHPETRMVAYNPETKKVDLVVPQKKNSPPPVLAIDTEAPADSGSFGDLLFG